MVEKNENQTMLRIREVNFAGQTFVIILFQLTYLNICSHRRE